MPIGDAQDCGLGSFPFPVIYEHFKILFLANYLFNFHRHCGADRLVDQILYIIYFQKVLYDTDLC